MPVDVVFFELRGRRCALPVSSVREIFPLGAVTPLPTAPPAVRGLTVLHGQVLPVVDIGPWLVPGGEAAARPPSEEAVAVEASLEGETSLARAALAVDRVLRLGIVDDERRMPPPPGPPFVVATVVDQGGPALLVDAAALLQRVYNAVGGTEP